MKNESVLLSIIIPVYNTEEYLEECIDSLLNQNLKDYELIFINDGSTDNSKDIIFFYKDKYPFVKYFEQENSGQGVARNVGINQARGKYIYFMDSDDYLVEDQLNNLLGYLEEHKLDGIFFDGETFFDENPEMVTNQFNYKRKKEYGLYSNGELLLNDLSANNDFIVSPCLYIIKTSILIDNDLYFPAKYKHEDEYFTATLLLYLGNVYHVNKIVFKRRVRQSSTMTNVNKIPSFIGYVNILSYFDEKFTSFNFLTTEGKKAYQKKMTQLTKAAFTSYSQVTDKSKVSSEWKTLKEFTKKYNYFGLSTYLYILITNNKTLLKLYKNGTNFIKKFR